MSTLPIYLTDLLIQVTNHEHLWARVTYTDQVWRIQAGWNMGIATQMCQFTTKTCVRRYLAGTWNVPHALIVGL